MYLYVYMSTSKTPIVVESNLAWAYPYWVKRKHLNPKLHWELR